MNVLPRACAQLLLVSLLCTTSLCQWSKSEWSCATSPWGLCVPVLGSRNTSSHVENTCCVFFLLFSTSPAFGDPPLPLCCCFAASFHYPGKTSISPWDQVFSGSPTAHFVFCIPSLLAGNRCVLSRAKSCTECIRVDKDCSFCTDPVRPCRAA